MEAVAASGNSQKLLELTQDTRKRLTSVSEMTLNKNGEPILGRKQRLGYWLSVSRSRLAKRAIVATSTLKTLNHCEILLDQSME